MNNNRIEKKKREKNNIDFVFSIYQVEVGAIFQLDRKGRVEDIKSINGGNVCSFV